MLREDLRKHDLLKGTRREDACWSENIETDVQIINSSSGLYLVVLSVYNAMLVAYLILRSHTNAGLVDDVADTYCRC